MKCASADSRRQTTATKGTGIGIGPGIVLAVAGAILLFHAVDIPNGWTVDTRPVSA